MDRRIIFPIVMFLLAAVSFVYGTWQYFHSRRVQTASDARMAHMILSIEDSAVSRTAKSEIYSAIMSNLPPVPKLFGIDFSGSFAATDTEDSCANDGQRSVCRALEHQSADPADIAQICGECNPK